MGFKLWSTNELLTSSDVNTYLMKQSVIVCTSGTRPGSPNDGMLVWETDTERYSSWNASLAAWVTLGQIVDGQWTPTLTAATTNPTMGSGSYVVGRYTLRNGKWCDVSFTVKFGSSGSAAGTGQYFVALPFTTAGDITQGVPYGGSAYLFGPAAIAQALVYAAASANTCSFVANNTTVSNSVPWTWTNNNYIAGSLTYRIA